MSLLSVRVTPELIHQLLPLMQDLVPAPSVNESIDSVNGNVLDETVLQTDETILQLYDAVDADQSASEDEEELSDERAIDKRYVPCSTLFDMSLTPVTQRVRAD